MQGNDPLPEPREMQLFLKLRPYLLFFLASILTIEIFLRIIRPEALIFAQNARMIFESHPVWKVDYRPDSYAHFYLRSWKGVTLYDFSINVNEHGFRVGSRQIDEKVIPDSSKRFVHAIGDSFTQGWGVNFEAAYPSQLDDMLEESTQVLNLGLNGYGAIAATEKSMRLWKDFPASHAIYLFYKNDFSDDQGAINRSEIVKNYVVPIGDLLRRNLLIANVPFYLRLLNVWRGPLSLTEDVARNGKWLSPKLDYNLTEIKVAGQEIDIANLKEDGNYTSASLGAIHNYSEFTKSRGAKFLVVVIEEEKGRFSNENKIIEKFCVKNNIDFVRLYADDELRLNSEGHLNKLGNYRLAKYIREWIQRQ